jgi:guanylate kinase
MTGNLYVVSAPSGAGKTTLVKALVESTPAITVSISHTTRLKRPAEIHSVNYYFIEKDEFNRMVEENEFLEHAVIFNNSYGTSRKWVEDTLARGLDVILEIDWQGCQQIQKIFPECICIFILPPTFQALANRLNLRNQDNADIIKQRLADAKAATSHIYEYDYVVLNDDFDTAVNDLKTIVLAGRLSQRAQTTKYAELITELVHQLDLETG